MSDHRVEVMLCVRDEHGLLTGRVDGARLRTANFTIDLANFNSAFRLTMDNGHFRVRRRQFGYRRWVPQVGNCHWDKFSLRAHDAARLLNYLRRRCGAMVESVSAEPDEMFHHLSELMRDDAADVTAEDLVARAAKPPAINMRHTADYEAALAAWLNHGDEAGKAAAIDWLIDHEHHHAAEAIRSGELPWRLLGAIRELAFRLPFRLDESSGRTTRSLLQVLPYLRPFLTDEFFELAAHGTWVSDLGTPGEDERPVVTQDEKTFDPLWVRWVESMAMRK